MVYLPIILTYNIMKRNSYFLDWNHRTPSDNVEITNSPNCLEYLPVKALLYQSLKSSIVTID